MFHRDNSSIKAIQDVLVNFYHADEIIVAKEVLWAYCGSHLGKYLHHKKSPNREAHVAHAEDIIKSILKMDQEGIKTPTFTAADLGPLPKFGPEELDLTSVVRRLNELEQNMARIDSNVAKQADTVASLLDAQCQTSGYAAVTKRGSVAFPDHRERPGASGTTRPSAGHQQVTPQGQGPSGGSTPVQRRPQNQGPPDIPRQQQSDSIPGHQQAEPPTGSETKSDNDDDFVLPKDQIRRQAKRDRSKNKPSAVFGKAGSGGITAATRTREILVFNLDPDTGDNDLSSCFQQLNVHVHELECRSHEESRTKSYRVMINMVDVEKVMNPDVWPEGVGLRMYFRQRKTAARVVNNPEQNHGY